VWANYKSNWAAENPNEKPPKTRFQIMIEFIKEKFEAETEEMKTRCEEYRVARQHEAASPDPVKSDSARNIAFQEYVCPFDQKRRSLLSPTDFYRNPVHSGHSGGMDF
jgi:hypothetical protein